MTDRTSVIGTSYTRRNAPIRGASTKGSGRPSPSCRATSLHHRLDVDRPGPDREPERLEELFLSRDRLVVGDAEPARQAGLGDHAQRDRLAVGEPLVFRGGLERVTDGVAVVEHVSQLGLALIALDDRGLEPAGAADDALEHAELTGHERLHVALDLGEVLGLQHHPVLGDLGEAGAKLALGQRLRHRRVDDDEQRLVKRADHVLRQRVVDRGLAPTEASTWPGRSSGSGRS
jgi:hypothetical protein